MEELFSQLSSRQIDLVKEPKGIFKNAKGIEQKKEASANYTDLFNRSEGGFEYLYEISRLWPYFEDNSKDYPSTAGKICNLFTEDSFKPILDNVFSVQSIGAPLDDLTEFDTKRINDAKIKLANYLLQLSTSYLFRASSFLSDVYPETLVKQAISTIRLMGSAAEKYQKALTELAEYKRREALARINSTKQEGS